LIRTRSTLAADYAVTKFFSAIQSAHNVLDRANTNSELFRLAVALERYKSAKGNYPETLDELVLEQYLEEVPIEPFTGRKTFVYKLAPDEETAVLLHSRDWDETNKEQFIRIAR
jgi:recombinational DNA repair protein (RecF pathway)